MKQKMQEMYQWGVMKEVNMGYPDPMFVSPIVLSREAHGKDAQNGTKYHSFVDFSKANFRMS